MTNNDADSETSFGQESIFSVPATVTTNTSFAPGELDDFRQELADFFLADEVLKELSSAGLHDAKIGKDRFQRNLHRLLKQFALGLKIESKSLQHLRAATFISNQSRAMAREICARLAGTSKTLKDREESSDESEEENEEPASEDEEYNFTEVKEFIQSSSAFQTLCENLENFVRPTFQSKFRELVTAAKREVDIPRGHVQDSWIRTCLSEVCGAEPSIIKLSRHSDKRWLNGLKVHIENWTGERWDWWPFTPAQHPLRDDQVRLRWLCVSLHGTVLALRSNYLIGLWRREMD